LEQPKSPIDTRDYFPLAAGNKWVYKYKFRWANGPQSTETREFVMEPKEAPDTKPAFAIDEPMQAALRRHQMLYAIRPEGIVTFAGFHGENAVAFNPQFVELPATLEPRAKWKWSGQLKGSSSVEGAFESTFQGIQRVKVPAGEFTCLKIRRVFVNFPDYWYIHWYAKGVGLVKMEAYKPETVLGPAFLQFMELTSYQFQGR
jgi:hypothetical protein